MRFDGVHLSPAQTRKRAIKWMNSFGITPSTRKSEYAAFVAEKGRRPKSESELKTFAANKHAANPRI